MSWVFILVVGAGAVLEQHFCFKKNERVFKDDRITLGGRQRHTPWLSEELNKAVVKVLEQRGST